MSTTRSLWCRCGGGMKATSNPGDVASRIAESFQQVHTEPGCEVTEDQALGRRWRAAVRRREIKTRVEA